MHNTPHSEETRARISQAMRAAAARRRDGKLAPAPKATPEQTSDRSAQQRDAWARLTPEQRAERCRRMSDGHRRKAAVKGAGDPSPATNGTLREAVEEARRAPAPVAQSNGHALAELLGQLKLGFAEVLDLIERRAAALRELPMPLAVQAVQAAPAEVAGDPLALTILREAVCVALAGDDHDEWTRAYEALCCAAIEYARQHPNHNTKPAARPEKAKK